jgi:hypothetical protein
MATLAVDARTLSVLLTRLARPHIAAVECHVDDRLTVRLIGARLPLLAAAKEPIVIVVHVVADAVDERTCILRWEIGDVSGVPAAFVRAAAGMGAVQRLLRKMCERTPIADALDIAKDSLRLHLDRIHGDARGILPMLRVRALAVPGARGQAVTASIDLVAPRTSRRTRDRR